MWSGRLPPAAFDFDFDSARVERTLLSAAFDVVFALTLGRFVAGYASRACPERRCPVLVLRPKTGTKGAKDRAREGARIARGHLYYGLRHPIYIYIT
jgi:hypothetical protein